MLCRETLYSKIEIIHHKTLKVVYESNGTYDNLLFESNTVSVHQRYLRFLMTETCKDMSHCLRKAYQKLIHFTMVRMQFIFVVLSAKAILCTNGK